MGTESPSVDPPAGFFPAIAEHSPLPMATLGGKRHLVLSANPAFARLMDSPADDLPMSKMSQQILDLFGFRAGPGCDGAEDVAIYSQRSAESPR